jgi:hypothetical protein
MVHPAKKERRETVKILPEQAQERPCLCVVLAWVFLGIIEEKPLFFCYVALLVRPLMFECHFVNFTKLIIQF